MALFKQPEFARECGISMAYLSMNKKRGKVTLTGELIDTGIQKNADFMQKCKDTAAKRALKSESKQDKPAKESKKKEKPAPDPKVLEAQKERHDALYSLDKEKKTIDIQKARRESELLEMRKRKLNGELIPTELIKSLIIQHSENIKNAYSDASENLIVIISQRKGMTSTEIAELRKEFTRIVNRAVDGAVDTTKKTFKNIVSTYSQNRGVGQHD